MLKKNQKKAKNRKIDRNLFLKSFQHIGCVVRWGEYLKEDKDMARNKTIEDLQAYVDALEEKLLKIDERKKKLNAEEDKVLEQLGNAEIELESLKMNELMEYIEDKNMSVDEVKQIIESYAEKRLEGVKLME